MTIFLDQQSEYTKYPCYFVCETVLKRLLLISKNSSSWLAHPIGTHFVNGKCSQYIFEMFPELSEAQIIKWAEYKKIGEGYGI